MLKDLVYIINYFYKSRGDITDSIYIYPKKYY